MLDEGYRRALALPADCVYPQFDLGAHSGVLEAVRRMQLPDAGLLTAELHALNIYPAGDFFKPHRDTPRADPGFVRSLVVCLPVGHSGGELVVEHGGQRVEYGWGAGAAAGEVQWAAFFSDCRHEVLAVAQGARVTLTYDLFAHPRECVRVRSVCVASSIQHAPSTCRIREPKDVCLRSGQQPARHSGQQPARQQIHSDQDTQHLHMHASLPQAPTPTSPTWPPPCRAARPACCAPCGQHWTAAASWSTAGAWAWPAR